MKQNKILNEYTKTGVLLPNPGYTPEQIAKWRQLINEEYQSDQSGRDGGRRYVTSDKLYELGILEEILNTKMESVILSIIPNPVFFHCHAYSIPNSQKTNHIGFQAKDGWHRDHVESGPSEFGGRAFSIFIYLTDLPNEDYGAFELIPSYFDGDNIFGRKSHRFFGKPGFTFLWDRCLFHRPHPNRASVSREIIKLSIHSNGYDNSRINEDEFTKLKVLSKDKNSFINYMAGGEYSPTRRFLPFNESKNLDICELSAFTPNSRTIYRPKISSLASKIKSKVLRN
ncbi:hypothetical protein KUL118_04450 [Tenacibaculum sp. KUL118]|nr:hypothetical protein KUL118_04450 [Tenacibaculum sp. KUL118]